ncbi:MAG: hypothetical protein JW939_04855, partial [Candidatus Thermoplasmatota archaeon]|nr:hypothetical protein [Candidatus Thermoplasmatota archaeon]
EEMLEPSISAADAERMIMKLSSEIGLIDKDIVCYPVYLGTIKGEGRKRYLVVDGITGKVDRTWSNSLTGKFRSRDRKGK